MSLTDKIEAEGFDLKALLDPDAASEVTRVMQICNACRYCEGFCAVFPAMTRRRSFDEGDVGYLANLCHNCGACYHACQYAPPHEFGVNVPQALAAARNDSYAAYAWPAPMAGLFRRNGLFVISVISLGLAITVGVMLAMIAPQLFWGVHVGEGAFYKIMPHTVMAGIPLAISAFVLMSFIMGWRRYWRHTGAKWGGFVDLFDAIKAAASLRHLGGDSSSGVLSGPGCPTGDDRSSNARRIYHQLTMYGFLLCFAATSVGTIYHYVLGREAPTAIWNCRWCLAQLAALSCVSERLAFLSKSGECILRFAMMKGLAWITLLSCRCFSSALPDCCCLQSARPAIWA